MSTLKLIWCVIYLASEKYTVTVTLISRDEKINASAVWGPLRLGGPGPPGPLDKTALLPPPVSEMTYTVSSGTLNPSIPYHTLNELHIFVLNFLFC